MGIRRVSINWARANKLGLGDASLHQIQIQMLAGVYMLAASNDSNGTWHETRLLLCKTKTKSK